jgi:hypothetical protein
MVLSRRHHVGENDGCGRSPWTAHEIARARQPRFHFRLSIQRRSVIRPRPSGEVEFDALSEFTWRSSGSSRIADALLPHSRP